LAGFSAKIGPARLILGGTDFGVANQYNGDRRATPQIQQATDD